MPAPLRAAGGVQDLAAGQGRAVERCPPVEQGQRPFAFEREDMPPGVGLDLEAPRPAGF
jgi:hypothetical protein